MILKKSYITYYLLNKHIRLIRSNISYKVFKILIFVNFTRI